MNKTLGWMFVVLGMLSIGTMYLVLRSEYTQEWKVFQKEFELDSKDIVGGITKSKPRKIKQTVLGKLKRIDRCMTCHLGINNDKFECSEQPFKSHSGQYLAWHPIESMAALSVMRGRD